MVGDLQQCLGQSLPGAAGDVVLAEAAGQLVEIRTGLVPALALEVAQRGGVLGDLRQLFRGFLRQAGQGRSHFGAVEIVLSAALVANQPAALELGELGRNPALTHAEQLLQVRHAQGLRFQKEQDPQPRRIGEKLQGFQH